MKTETELNGTCDMSALQKKLLKSYPYFLVVLSGIMLFSWLNFSVQPILVGDGSEYYAYFLSFAVIHRPWMEKESYDKYEEVVKTNSIIGLHSRQHIENDFPALKVRRTSDFNHFWFYSFLAYLVFAIFKLFGIILSPHASFLMLHTLLFSGAVALAFHFFRWKGFAGSLLLLFASPILWNTAHVHTEFFTFSLTLAAILCLMKSKYLPAAFFLATASTQNPHFAIIALIPFLYHFIRFYKQPFSLFDVICIVATGFVAVIHPVYYFFRYGVLSPQFLAGGASFGENLKYWYVYLIDPDLGLLLQWPLGIPLILFLLVFACTHWKQSRQYLAGNKFFLIFTGLFVVLCILAQASSQNINSGGCISIQRYALWFIPLFFPILYLGICFAGECRIKIVICLSIIFSCFIFLNWYQFNPNCREHCWIPSPFSYFIQKYLPKLYNPPPEVFIERYSGLGETCAASNTKIIIGPDGHKALFNPIASGTPRLIAGLGIVPSEKNFKQLCEELSRGKNNPFYFSLSDKQLVHIQTSIPISTDIKTITGSPWNGLLDKGWASAEPWGTWSCDKYAKIIFPYTIKQKYYGMPYIFVTLNFQTFSPPQRLRVIFNGEKLYQGTHTGASSITVCCPLEPVLASKKKYFTVNLEIPDAVSPCTVIKGSEDGRILGIGLTSIQVNSALDIKTDFSCKDGNKIIFSKDKSAFKTCFGFFRMESWGTWSNGPNSEMYVALPKKAKQYHSIRLTLRPFLSKHGKQEVEIKINDRLIKKVIFTSPQDQEVLLPIPKNAESVLKFNFTVGEPTSPAELNQGPDERKLGFGLISLQYEKN